MAHSTTATSTYVLAKYSRSYPSKSATQSQDTLSEWQHFTNPLISLILDIKKSSNNELESVRLRIVWRINHDGAEDGLNNTEVVFEDIDLLSFSALGSRVPQKQNSQGFPLKAVYRDTVVGIRYMHPRDQNQPLTGLVSKQTFRRFQVSFLSPSFVSEFISAIRTVCPCKANPTNPQASNLNPIPTVIGPFPSLGTQPHAQLLNNINSLQPDRGGPFPLPSTGPAQVTIKGSQVPFSSPLGITHHGTSSSFNAAIDPPIFSPPTTTAGYGPQLTDPLHISSRYPVPDISLQPASASPPSINQTDPNPSPPILPASSSLPSSERSATNCDKTITSNTPSFSLSDPVLASLQEATSIYNLSSTTLEQVVGDVVMEDGFPRLLEQLSSLWKIRSIVGV